MTPPKPNGYFKVWRALLEDPMWLKERFTIGQAWADIFGRANYAESKVIAGGRLITVRRGQLLTSQVELARRWQWDRETVRRYLGALIRDGKATIETSNQTRSGYTLITVLKYELYQGEANSDPALGAAAGAPVEPAAMPQPCPTSEEEQEGKKEPTRLSGKPDALALDSGETISGQNTPSQAGFQGQARDVLDYLNLRTGRSYRPVPANLDPIVARLKSQVTVEECKAVIDARVAEWGQPPKPGQQDMRKYLRPETLFRASKFEGYLGALGSASTNGHAPGRTQSGLTSRAQAFLREQEAAR